MLAGMDDLGFGLALRRVRLRRDERQADVAERAGISQATYSEIERGNVGGVTIRKLRRACEALEIRLELVARWRGGDLDRLIHGRHAAMTSDLARRLAAPGWDFAPKVSFNSERGFIDLLGWQSRWRALLVVELKTELVDPQELLGVMDRRLRLARKIGLERGWEAATISAWVVVADSRMNRRHVAAVRPLLRASFPEDGRAARAWARRPDRRQLALWFLSDNSPTSGGRHLAPRKRVRRAGVRRVRPRDRD
jgi:transcriptional regulator with XRE-family HTH domain